MKWPTALALIFLCVCVVYLPVLSHDFVGDDYNMVVNNTFIKSWENFPRLFDRSYISSNEELNGIGEIRSSGLVSYRPLMTFSTMLDYQVWGDSSFGHHLTQLLLHAANAMLVFFIGMMLFKETAPALLSSLLFALHPMGAESINILAYRGDLLCAFFFNLAFLAFVRYGRKAWALGLYGAALFSRESAIALPFVLVAHEWLTQESGKASLLHCLRKYFWFAALTLAYLAVWWFFSQEYLLHPIETAQGLTAWRYALTILKSLGLFLKNLIYPSGLHIAIIDISDFVRSPYEAGAWIGAGVILSCVALFLFFWKKKEAVPAFSLAWIFLCYAPNAGRIFLKADRYWYLSAAGLAWFLVWALVRCEALMKKRYWRAVPAICAAGLLVFYGLKTTERNRVFETQYSSVSEIVAHYPKDYKPHLILAALHREKKMFDAALREAKTALELNPGFWQCHLELGRVYYSLGDLPNALAYFDRVLEQKPLCVEAYIWKGSIYGIQGKDVEAIPFFEKALEIDPRSSNAYFNLGVAYLHQGRQDKVREVLGRAAVAMGRDFDRDEKLLKLAQVLL